MQTVLVWLCTCFIVRALRFTCLCHTWRNFPFEGRMLCKLRVTMQGQSHEGARRNSHARKAMHDFGNVAVDLSIAQNRFRDLNGEYRSTERILHHLRQEERALNVELQQLAVESTRCEWCATPESMTYNGRSQCYHMQQSKLLYSIVCANQYVLFCLVMLAARRVLQDAEKVHAKVFSKDLKEDECELKQTRQAVAQQRRRRHSLVSAAVEVGDRLDCELAQQVQGIKSVTAEWKELKGLVAKASETLEGCRVRRVQAEQDHKEHVNFGGARYLSLQNCFETAHVALLLTQINL